MLYSVCYNFQVLVSDTSPLPSVDVIKSHYLKGELFILLRKVLMNHHFYLAFFVSFPSVSDSRVAIMSAKWVGGSLVLSFLIVLKGLKKQASLDDKLNDINSISNNYLPFLSILSFYLYDIVSAIVY